MFKYLILVSLVGLLAACGTAEASMAKDVLAQEATANAPLEVLRQPVQAPAPQQNDQVNARVKSKRHATQLRNAWQTQTNACDALNLSLETALTLEVAAKGDQADEETVRSEFIANNAQAWNTCRAHPAEIPPERVAEITLAFRQGVAGDMAELTLDVPYEKLVAAPSRTLFASNFVKDLVITDETITQKIDSLTVTPELRTIKGLGTNPLFAGNTLVELPCTVTVEMHSYDGDTRLFGDYSTTRLNCLGYTSLDPATTSWENLERDIVVNIALRFDVDILADAMEAFPEDSGAQANYIQEQIRGYLD